MIKVQFIFTKTYVLFKEQRKSYIFRVSSKKEEVSKSTVQLFIFRIDC